MAQTIKIKRSSSTTAPTSLASGELAYSTKTGVQKLYYGDGTDVLAIGGKSYTDKLDGIEAGATADQTDAQIRAAVEAASDSNVFTDADHSKLDLIGAANGTNAADASVVASANNLGVIRIGDGLSIAANGEVSADEVTSTSVTNAGALMDSEVTNLAQVKEFSSADYATAAQGTLATNALPKAGGTLTGNLSFGDNVKAQFGASDDLQIYHDGNNSIIKDAGSGVLRYTSSSSSAAGVVFEIENTDTDAASGSFIHFKDSSGLDPCKIGAVGSSFFVMSPTNEYMIKANSNSDVELYYDNAKKLETTLTGINVVGEVKGDSLDIDGDADISGGLTAGNFTFTGDEIISSGSTMTLDPHADGITGKVVVNGDLEVKGTTTTIDSTTVTIEDPIFTLGGDTPPSSDDNLDRGIEFRWHNATAAKLGFFGFDDSTGEFTFIPDATNSSNVMSGTKGTANFGALKLDTDLAVAYGGTGRSSFTTNGIAYGNGASAIGVTVAGAWDSTHSVGQLLSVNSSGVPTWTNNIDGGTF